MDLTQETWSWLITSAWFSAVKCLESDFQNAGSVASSRYTARFSWDDASHEFASTASSVGTTKRSMVGAHATQPESSFSHRTLKTGQVGEP
jgi:hypothetical protein